MNYKNRLVIFSLGTIATFGLGCSSSSESSTDAGNQIATDGGPVGGSAGAGSAATDASGGAAADSTVITGKLGALGDVKPTVSSWVISNSGETLIYFSSAPLDCSMLQTQGVGWLSSVPSGAQVIEIVIKGDPKVGAISVHPAEFNYAPGGMSSAHEKSATAGSINFKTAAAKGAVSGTLNASFSDGTQVSGNFAAEFCPNGSQY
jgi:hypothetical protein